MGDWGLAKALTSLSLSTNVMGRPWCRQSPGVAFASLGTAFSSWGTGSRRFIIREDLGLGWLTGSTYLVRASHSFSAIGSTSCRGLGSRPMGHCWGTPRGQGWGPSGSLVEGLKVREDASADSFLLPSRLQAQGR